MHRLRLWLDRQLIEESWPYRGFSPLNWFILAVILFSAVLFAAETEPLAVARYPLVLQAANLAILTVFALEFALRLFSAGETRGLKGLSARTAYAGRFWLLLDFLAFGPELILLALLYAGADIPLTLAGLRAIRLLRLVKLIHYMPGGRLMSEVLTDVAPQLLATLIAALGLIYLAAVLIYYAEGGVSPEHFGSVGRSLWWSVITLTTVGYGDVYPVTVLGRIVAGVLAIIGVGIIALPTGIIAGAFMERLQAERVRQAGRRIRPRADHEN
ncbi:MAG: cation transporter [Parvibaculum sp.]|jgi:voltage-gated potassium channel|uniref:ion transporter n=1 Tax=Parvibaculum sp. TaxID=2024848 RepID=UPI000C4C80CA|nr:ion transporter [Parvibaculum sp.]MAU62525.1 cation transporter [Parvibaculum sp.]|tara:strand:+ start:635 stop:1447 length:813 start_codon:yes stop_codon:yes gene_type:complete